MCKKPNKKKDFAEKKILVIVSIALLVFLILSASFFLVFFDKSFYDKEFNKYGQYDEFGVQGVRNTVDYLIKYLTSENRDIGKAEGLSIFLPDERSHLEDVRNLINGAKVLSICSLIILFALALRLKKYPSFADSIRKILIYSSITMLGILAVIFLLSLNFPAFFEGFHKLLFPQGNYTFPANYLLIKLFPEGFFNDYAKKMFFHTIIISLILLFLGSSSAFAFRNSRRH